MDEEENQQNPVALALANMSGGYTTPEAQALAKRTFDELYNERGQYSAEEQAAMRQLDATANAAKDALKTARDKLLSERYNEQAKWFALAGAFGQPSKSGRFGENLGRVGNVLADHSMKRREFGQTRDANALKLLGEMHGIDEELIKQKLALIKARRDADKGLMTESLKVLGREIRPGRGTGTAGMSPFGKIAADEGFQPGTNLFNQRVRQLYNEDLHQRRQASGVDTEEENPEDTHILAQTYGVPISNVDPFRGLSTKAKQAAVQRSMTEGEKALSALAEQDSLDQSAIRQIDRFMALNEDEPSGPLYGIPGISWLTGWSTAAQEMDQIRADIARKQRQPGEGQVSNFDAAQFLIASPGRGKNYETNKNIASGIKIAKQLGLEQRAFLRNYLAVNRHMSGAKEAWNRYLESNPIFDPTAKRGTFKLNEKRIDYQTWFRSQMGAYEDPNAPPIEPVPGARQRSSSPAVINEVEEDPTLAGLSPEEKRWATTPAYAKGGKVAVLADTVNHPKVIALKSAIERLMGQVHNVPAMRMPAPPRDPALSGIATRKEALLRDLITRNISPRDTEELQQTSQTLDLVLNNATPDAMQAEALMRSLQDIASRYRRPIQKQQGGQVEAGERAMIDQILREIAQGGTYNFSDEILSGGDPEALQQERALLEEFGNENPLIALGLQGAGAVPTGMAAGYAGHKLLSALRGPQGPQFHPKLGMKKGKAAGIAGLIERILPKSAIGKMATSGVASGAIAGAGASQGDRGGDAVEHGLIGGLMSPVGGLGAKFGLAGTRRGLDFLRGTTPRGSDEKVLAALANDSTNLDEVVKRMEADKRARVPSMIGDSAGKNTAALQEAVAGKSGRGPAELAGRMERRQATQGDRIEDQVNRALKPSEFFAEEQKLKDALYTNAKPLYQQAYASTKPILVNDVAFLFNSREGKRAMKDAVNLMNTKGSPVTRKTIFGKNVKDLSLETLDHTKQALDDMISKEEVSGATARGSALRSMRNKLRDLLDARSPDYKAARAQYAGDLEVLDALRQGREKFNTMTPKQVENLVANMSFAEKDAYRTGVAEVLFGAIGKTPRGSNVAAKVIGTPAPTAKLAHLFDNPRDAAKFNDALMREFSLFKQSQGAISNAARQRAGAASEGLDDTPLANAADFALDAGQQAVFLPGIAQNTGGPWTSARLMQWVRNRMPMSEQTANEVADTLAIDDPKAAKAAIDRLKAEGERLQKRERVSGAVARAAGRATAVATAPDPWAQMEEE